MSWADDDVTRVYVFCVTLNKCADEAHGSGLNVY